MLINCFVIFLSLQAMIQITHLKQASQGLEQSNDNHFGSSTSNYNDILFDENWKKINQNEYKNKVMTNSKHQSIWIIININHNLLYSSSHPKFSLWEPFFSPDYLNHYIHDTTINSRNRTKSTPNNKHFRRERDDNSITTENDNNIKIDKEDELAYPIVAELWKCRNRDYELSEYETLIRGQHKLGITFHVGLPSPKTRLLFYWALLANEI